MKLGMAYGMAYILAGELEVIDVPRARLRRAVRRVNRVWYWYESFSAREVREACARLMREASRPSARPWVALAVERFAERVTREARRAYSINLVANGDPGMANDAAADAVREATGAWTGSWDQETNTWTPDPIEQLSR